MKLYVSILIFLASLTSLANVDRTAECRASAQQILKKSENKDVQVYSVLAVGPGTYDIDHLIIYGYKNLGGVVNSAIMTSDVFSCNFREPSAIKSIY